MLIYLDESKSVFLKQLSQNIFSIFSLISDKLSSGNFLGNFQEISGPASVLLPLSSISSPQVKALSEKVGPVGSVRSEDVRGQLARWKRSKTIQSKSSTHHPALMNIDHINILTHTTIQITLCMTTVPVPNVTRALIPKPSFLCFLQSPPQNPAWCAPPDL